MLCNTVNKPLASIAGPNGAQCLLGWATLCEPIRVHSFVLTRGFYVLSDMKKQTPLCVPLDGDPKICTVLWVPFFHAYRPVENWNLSWWHDILVIALTFNSILSKSLNQSTPPSNCRVLLSCQLCKSYTSCSQRFRSLTIVAIVATRSTMIYFRRRFSIITQLHKQLNFHWKLHTDSNLTLYIPTCNRRAQFSSPMLFVCCCSCRVSLVMFDHCFHLAVFRSSCVLF